MSASLKVAEIVVRIIIIVVQILGVVGGALVVVLLSNTSSDTINSLQHGIGGAVIVISGLMLIYEVLMIVLSLIKKVNHSARLLADVVISCLMIAMCTVTYVVAIGFAGILLLFIILLRDLRLVFPLPIAFGILSSVVFIVPAISSAYIRWKITRTDRRVDQPAASATIDSETTPATLTIVQQLISDHPPDTAGADCDPPAYYSIVGEGDTSQNAHSPFYSQAQPGVDPPAATASEADSPQNAHDYPMVPTATGGGVEDGSNYSRALPMERIALTAVADDQTGHDEPPSYVSIIA